jgi:hypothetical protein
MSTLIERIKRDIDQEPYYAQNYSNDGQRFLAWYLRNVLLRTSIQAHDDITDGPDDKQIDAIVIDDEKRQVIILQGKFITSGKVDHEPLNEILAAWMQIKNIPALQEGGNVNLKSKLEAVSTAIHDDDYEVIFELLTTGELTKSAKDDLASFQETISEFEHPACSLTLVDSAIIKSRWDEALSIALPRLDHQIILQPGKFLSLKVANFKTVLAAVRLSDVLTFPGVKDQTLFRKNVRQSLGITNRINKGLKQTLSSDTSHFFFLYHNGITAICDKLEFDEQSHELRLQGLSVVNGCQSINTIFACSQKIRDAEDSYVLFRFYEIPQVDIADRISIFTNSQSAVKPRDLRSNDKRIVALKVAFENAYPDGFMITKRGQERPADRDANKTIDISELIKALMAWHCQRPNNANNENRLFDKHFDQLIKNDYAPTDILALNQWIQEIDKMWGDGSVGLNEVLLAVPSIMKHHLLFGVQMVFSIANNQHDKVPKPSATMGSIREASSIIAQVVSAYNSALDGANQDAQEKGKVFSPQNWLKSKESMARVKDTLRVMTTMLAGLPGGKEFKEKFSVPPQEFGLRWTAE